MNIVIDIPDQLELREPITDEDIDYFRVCLISYLFKSRKIYRKQAMEVLNMGYREFDEWITDQCRYPAVDCECPV